MAGAVREVRVTFGLLRVRGMAWCYAIGCGSTRMLSVDVTDRQESVVDGRMAGLTTRGN